VEGPSKEQVSHYFFHTTKNSTVFLFHLSTTVSVPWSITLPLTESKSSSSSQHELPPTKKMNDQCHHDRSAGCARTTLPVGGTTEVMRRSFAESSTLTFTRPAATLKLFAPNYKAEDLAEYGANHCPPLESLFLSTSDQFRPTNIVFDIPNCLPSSSIVESPL
jgi:hypothetical protein